MTETDPQGQSRQKIAILGGGMAALAAAFELTSQPDWKENYEVTVYQLGWRLGGKGASSRGPYGRIEEHGLHVWLGSYENAFHLMQRCYQELARPLGEQLATWEEAFKPCNIVALDERVGEKFVPWLLNIPMRASVPGMAGRDAAAEPTAYEALAHGVHALHSAFGASRHGASRLNFGRALLSLARWLSVRVHRKRLPPRQARRHHSLVAWLLDRFRNWLWRKIEPLIEADDLARRLFTLLDFGIANIRGVIADDLILCGFDRVDDLDYREWLRKHGAKEHPTLDSVLIRALYDLGFSYLDGDPQKPQFAAGAAIRVVLRMVLYRGAFVWDLQAGMGETIFAPLYLVLKQRGVHFQFFHRVTDLVPGTRDGKPTIAQIKLARQVALIDAGAEYDPLAPVNGMLCWPPHPRTEQLREGEKLKDGGYNLESFWTPWKDADPDVTLEAGRHFDRVILGISLGSFPYLCAKLRQEPRWAAMLDQMPTVQTQAFQLWLKPDSAGLGWPFWKHGRYILDTNHEPFDTWADMSHLLLREMWPGDHFPSSVHYFCSSLPGGKVAPPPTEHGFPEQEHQRVEQHAVSVLRQFARRIWPNSARGNDFNWNLVVDPQERRGEARMRSQFFRANVDPSERYVYAAPGTLRYRMRPDDSGFANLYLAGDWTKNGLNVGAMESAVMAGMEASRAICGHPQYVAYEKFGDPAKKGGANGGLAPELC